MQKSFKEKSTLVSIKRWIISELKPDFILIQFTILNNISEQITGVLWSFERKQ